MDSFLEITDERERALSNYSEGRFELSPVQFTQTTGAAHEYPLIQQLNLAFDVERLKADFEECAARLSSRYLQERSAALPISWEEVSALLTSLGFDQKYYSAIGLMRVGTTELLTEVPSYTASVLQQFSPFCRAHYVVAQPGFKTRPHIDCPDYLTHGFRIHIPLFNTAHYTFYKDGAEHEFELVPGKAWFFNNAMPHVARNLSTKPRVSILLQLMADAKLLAFLKA